MCRVLIGYSSYYNALLFRMLYRLMCAFLLLYPNYNIILLLIAKSKQNSKQKCGECVIVTEDRQTLAVRWNSSLVGMEVFGCSFMKNASGSAGFINLFYFCLADFGCQNILGILLCRVWNLKYNRFYDRLG